MLEKRVSTNGKIYTNIINLTQWAKNPRAIYEKDVLRLKIQIATLGQYKPLFVTSDGIMVGGNMRLPNMLWLNENILEWDDEKGNHYSIDKRGQFTEVWITELGFVEVASPDGSTRYRATLDGKVQEKIFGSIEQMMIEYAISDNDGAGFYEQQKLAELIHPYQELIDTSKYKLALSPEVSMKTFLDEFQPSDGPDLPTNKNIEKDVNLNIKFSPEQFAQIKPLLESGKTLFGVESNTDLFVKLLDHATATAIPVEAATTESPIEQPQPTDNGTTPENII